MNLSRILRNMLKRASPPPSYTAIQEAIQAYTALVERAGAVDRWDDIDSEFMVATAYSHGIGFWWSQFECDRLAIAPQQAALAFALSHLTADERPLCQAELSTATAVAMLNIRLYDYYEDMENRRLSLHTRYRVG